MNITDQNKNVVPGHDRVTGLKPSRMTAKLITRERVK